MLLWGMIISGPIYSVVTKTYNFIPSVYVPTIAVALIALYIIRKENVNNLYGVYIQIALWLNLLGEYYFYYHWQYYDKFLHFAIPLFITVMIYKYFAVNSKGPPKKWLVFLTVLGVGAFFEIFEYFQSGIFHFPSVGVYANSDLVMPPYSDTIWDLVCNSLGSLTYLLFREDKLIKIS